MPRKSKSDRKRTHTNTHIHAQARIHVRVCCRDIPAINIAKYDKIYKNGLHTHTLRSKVHMLHMHKLVCC